jgi:hypothetical protein
MTLRQDDAGVNGKQAEDDPKVEEDRKKALELDEGFLF